MSEAQRMRSPQQQLADTIVRLGLSREDATELITRIHAVIKEVVTVAVRQHAEADSIGEVIQLGEIQ